MTTPDLITMIGNLSQSLISMQSLLTGLAYILGILFFVTGLIKIKGIGKHSREKPFVAVAYLFGGALLIFLPTSLEVFSNTLFGSSSALSYTDYNPTSIYSSMHVLVQTAGLIWFIRGCVLLIHASEPGEQHAANGVAFVFAGILAMNIEYTVQAIETAAEYIISIIP